MCVHMVVYKICMCACAYGCIQSVHVCVRARVRMTYMYSNTRLYPNRQINNLDIAIYDNELMCIFSVKAIFDISTHTRLVADGVAAAVEEH